MTLVDAVKAVLSKAYENELTVWYFRDLLGGKVRSVVCTQNTQEVVIVYPEDWELYLVCDVTGVKVVLRHALRPNLQVNVGLLPFDREAFSRFVRIALDVMDEGEEV